ncbi:DUF262 domain-containing protein [Paenibacillus xylanexedens]|uniref:GmrSD restriction endonuclease domain-containing protein n=1 Tax=Paenibacillus xylanexedens TaxID=528191 RepID=UPI001C8E0C1F|nr:DUF262 domain-containing protein [Paenibacillus xylanexedens]MBY0118350.1 DUF262 domain-containing protein [Paenibacillus xylanexedens]
MVDPQQTESIKTLMEGIHKNNIYLPEFQRDFVWDVTKTYDLFDSLVRDIFIGSIIYGKPSFEITVREIDSRPRRGKGSRAKLMLKSFSKDEIERLSQINNFRLILDGQQRATSIYRALKGIDEVWLVIKNDDELSEEAQEKDFRERSLEDMLFEFSGREDEDRLSIKLSDAYSISYEELLEDEMKAKFFDSLSYTAGMDELEEKGVFRKYILVARKLIGLYGSEKLLSYYLLNMSTEKFALFFERSNSRGIQLNFIDILAAKLYSGFNLRGKIEEFETDNQGSYYELNREIIVRAIAYIVSDAKEVDKTYILTNLNHEHFNAHWDEVCVLFKKSLDYLYKENIILSQAWMPYENMLIPLMMFLRELNGNDFSQMDQNQHKFIIYWYWASIFSQRYSSGSNEVIIQDSNLLRIVAKKQKITDRIVFSRLKPQIQSYEDVLSYSKKGSVIYKGILNIVNYAADGLKDWSNTSRLSASSKLEDHHIFPVAFIREAYKNDEIALSLTDCVVNRTLIPKITNIRIGKKAPSIYMGEMKNHNQSILECLKNHLIPEEIINGVYDEFYNDFLEERAKMIYDVIKIEIWDQQKQVIDLFYAPPVNKQSGNIKIFATYHRKRKEATYDIDTQKVFYEGAHYSVSSAADKAKEDMTGKTNTSTNGWRFWKYIDEIGQERFINDFREANS